MDHLTLKKMACFLLHHSFLSKLAKTDCKYKLKQKNSVKKANDSHG